MGQRVSIVAGILKGRLDLLRVVAVLASIGLLMSALSISEPAFAQGAGPEGQVYQVQVGNIRYTVRLNPGGRYEDSRPRTGRWQYDGRTLCMLVASAGPRQPEYEVCGPWQALDVGDSYTSRYWAPDGTPARVTRMQ